MNNNNPKLLQLSILCLLALFLLSGSWVLAASKSATVKKANNPKSKSAQSLAKKTVTPKKSASIKSKSISNKPKAILYPVLQVKSLDGMGARLVRPKGTADTYWFGPNDKLYLITHPDIIKSWYGNSKPSIYQAPVSEFAHYPKAGSLFPRAGTYLLKFGNNNSIYALEPKGLLRPIQDQATARKFYGSNWQKRIISFAPEQKSYFTLGRVLVFDDYPPEGTLVKKPGKSEVYQAKWKQLTLFYEQQLFAECNYLREWVVEGDWNYPENPAYRNPFLYNCYLDDQMPKMVIQHNALAQKEQLKVLNVEFYDANTELKPDYYLYCKSDNECYQAHSQEYAKSKCPTCAIKPMYFFDVFNSKESVNIGTSVFATTSPGYQLSQNIYDVKYWFEDQYAQNGRKLTMDFDVAGPYQLDKSYGDIIGGETRENFIVGKLEEKDSAKLSSINIFSDKYDVVNYIFYAPSPSFLSKTPSSSGGRNDNFIVFFWDSITNEVPGVLHSLGHEMSHTLGAGDIHQGEIACPEPDGLAYPFQEPTYPQKKGVIMCSGRFIERDRALAAGSVGDKLADWILGESVIRDFGWK